METSLLKLKDLNNDDYKPLYVQLAEFLADYIQKHGLHPRDPIPPENDLIQRYGVSRMTVRIAMQRMEMEGIIKKIQGRGTFVAEPKIRNYVRGARSLEETFAGQGIQVTNTLLEYDITYPTQIWLKDLNLPEGTRTFKIRRLKKIDDQVLGLEVRLLPLDVAGRFSIEELSNQPFIDLLRRSVDTEIHRVAYRMRIFHLLEREAEAMGVPVGTPALVRAGVHYNSMDKPMMAGRVTFLAEKVELHFEIR